MNLSFAERSMPDAGTLVVGVLADKVLTAGAEELDRLTDGQIGRVLAGAGRFTGKREDAIHIAAPAGLPVERVTLIGLGGTDDLDGAAWQKIGGSAMAQLNAAGAVTAAVWLDAPAKAPVGSGEAAAAFAAGARLRAYRFDRYRTREKAEAKPSLSDLVVMTDDHGVDAEQRQRVDALVAGVTLTRDLVSEPANVLFPESFAERCLPLRDAGLAVEVLDEDDMRAMGMGALLGVGQGSARSSRLVVLQWYGADAERPPVAFVGKGVTFDTGGISLKPGAGMEEMKWDMAGAGAVVGVMRVLAGRKAKVNAVGILGLVENMPSATAQRPGDVVTSMSGQTIEVINTDAEGRLVLADALWYTQQRFKPAAMIDLATLTGAIMVALGTHQAGLFASDDALADQLLAAGKATGEPLWRMPLGEPYDREIDSEIADMKNVAGHRNGGAAVAAQFLKRFVQDVPWAHLDIAGMAWSKKDRPTVPKGATGFGVCLLDRFVADTYER
ncbi:MAG: leucyl aminopeptidase [Rhodospirillaceae bacterium]|nr:leucyl aminopeptidase [Rhodospirillaceae bacterium]